MPPNATALALTAIGLWSFLAYLGARVSHLSPFLVVGLALTFSGLLGLPLIRAWRVSLRTYLVGIGGLFGYHFLYFSAFRHAPAIGANLINYLWPLLIVVLSPLLLRSTPLRSHHLIGAVVGFAGAGLIVTGGRVSLDLAHLRGYLIMTGAALTWATYSLLTKRLPLFPTGAVGGFCLASGLLSMGIYALRAQPGMLMPELSLRDGLALVALGLGPMGAAFHAWDAALKRGDPKVIGSLAYLTPLFSTLVLVALGGRMLTWTAGAAMTLIVSGVLIGSLDLWRPGSRPRAVGTADG
ncbi:MAG: EamA family transporter [Chloroflexota bacterium]